jgi:hypothetical protein
MTYKKTKTTRNPKRLRGSKRRFKGGDPEPGVEAGSESAPERKTWSSWLSGTSKAVGNSTAKTAENTTLLGMFYKMFKPKKSETSVTNTDVQKESSGETTVNPDVSLQTPPVENPTTEAPPKTGGRRQKRKTTKRK